MPPYIHPSRMANFSGEGGGDRKGDRHDDKPKGPSFPQRQPSASRWGARSASNTKANGNSTGNANSTPLGTQGWQKTRRQTLSTQPSPAPRDRKTQRPANGRAASLPKVLLPHQQREREPPATPPAYSQPYLVSAPQRTNAFNQHHTQSQQSQQSQHSQLDLLHVNRYSLNILVGCAVDEHGALRAYDALSVCAHYVGRTEGGGLSEREACEKSFGIFSMCGLVTGIHAEQSLVFITFDTQLAALRALNLPKHLREYDIGDFTFEFVPTVKWCSVRGGWRVIPKGLYDLLVPSLRANDPAAHRAQDLYGLYPRCAQQDTSLVPADPPHVEQFANLPQGVNILPLDLEERPQFAKRNNSMNGMNGMNGMAGMNGMRASNAAPAVNPAFFGFGGAAHGAPGANPQHDGFMTLRTEVLRANGTYN